MEHDVAINYQIKSKANKAVYEKQWLFTKVEEVTTSWGNKDSSVARSLDLELGIKAHSYLTFRHLS